MLHGTAYKTPMGHLVALASDAGLTYVGFELERVAEARQGPHPTLRAFENWLQAYLAKRFRALPALPLAPEGSPFDQEVWQALQRIPLGSTITYGALAKRLGQPGSARAVGGAVGRNPLTLVVPCHRVVGQKGLTGFSSGVERKVWMLKHEGVLLL